jgi:mRNA interferase RelE/StbE
MYHIEIKKSAQKELAEIPAPYNRKIVDAIDGLAEEPRPQNVKKLKGEDGYRIRVGDYRVIYTIEDVVKIVEVQRVRNRKDAYR